MTQTNDPPLISSLELIPDANEKADLDAPSGSGGKLVIGQAPNITITETTVVADADERLALDVQEGDIAIQTNVSSSFIFTGGDNVAPNWQVVDFDAVGAIAGETISPANVNISGSLNGADTSAAAAGEALTSNGSGSLQFASVGGIEEVATFGDLPPIDPPQIAYVVDQDEYYHSNPSRFFDIASASFETSIPSQDSNPRGIAWNNDGSRLYEVGDVGDKIYQSTVSTAFDITTATFDTSISTQGGTPTGIAWNDDGSRLYEVGRFPEKIYQSTLSTPFDITTASFDTSIDSQDSDPRGIAWNNDGTRLYETGNGSQKIYQSTVSTAFDITTATFDTSIASQSELPFDIAFNDDGSRLYEVGVNPDEFTQFTLSTPFDITTASFDTSISSQDATPTDIAFNDDGTRLYEVGSDSSRIYQYVIDGWGAF